jgi:cysteine desulfuration protein SufE
MTIQERVDEYKSDFDLFDDPNDKLEYIFDLGKAHEGLEASERTESNRIVGCASDAWLVCECDHDVVHFRGEGTSEMAKGMMEMLLSIFGERTADEILSFDPAYLQTMGIVELLSPVRQQSLEAFLGKVYGYAQACKEN